MQKATRILGNKVTPLSPDFIREQAFEYRHICQGFIGSRANDVDLLRVIDKLYNADYLSFESVDVHEMPNEYAITFPSQKKLIVRRDTMEGARRGEPRARFTLAHELGHLFLHTDTVPQFARSQAPSLHDFTEDVEWQANEFAGWFLIGPDAIEQAKNPRHLTVNYKVSMDMAMVMWTKIQKLKS